MQTGWWFILTGAAGVLVAMVAHSQTVDEALTPMEHPAIQYYQGPLDDRVTRLMKDLESGSRKLELKEGGVGYLASLLEALGVNADSQSLVFAKNSFQASRISPRNPRAIYFSDDVTVGYVRGSNLLEVAALDPKQGVIFYSFDQERNPPRFDRRDVCLQCHESKGTLGVPGLLIASVYPDADGMPAFRGAQNVTDHSTPFEDRWGGWYVTGTHGEMRHLGNAVGHEPDHPELLDSRGALNLTSLAKKFDPANYLSATSDIVALMTLEHQTRMTDLIIRVGWEARMIEHDARPGAKVDASAQKRFESDPGQKRFESDPAQKRFESDPAQKRFESDPAQKRFESDPAQKRFESDPAQKRFESDPAQKRFESDPAQKRFESDPAQKRFESDVDALVAYMLFADEAHLYDAVQGVSTFTKTFAERGPRDRKGRSLREFDLQTRLFKYPLSYMIYSEAFDGMPAQARERIYQRIYDVLTGKDQSPRFQRLSNEDRQAIFEIVADTKPGLPAYWRPSE